LFSDPERCKADLLRAGFVQPRVVHAAQAWRVPSPETVVETIVQATVRASATLRAQTPEARQAIIAQAETMIYRLPSAARPHHLGDSAARNAPHAEGEVECDGSGRDRVDELPLPRSELHDRAATSQTP
jgi:hypothetical protein